MKKFFSILIMCMMFICTSCSLTAQGLAYNYDFLYLNQYYPVMYIDNYPYYFYNSRWVLIPHHSYRYIRYHTRPCYYVGADSYYFKNRVIHIHKSSMSHSIRDNRHIDYRPLPNNRMPNHNSNRGNINRGNGNRGNYSHGNRGRR